MAAYCLSELMKVFRSKIFISCILAALFVPIAFIFWNCYLLFSAPITKKPEIISIDKASSASSLVSMLKKNNYISKGSLLLLIMRLEGLTGQLKAGVYQIRPGESAMQLIQRIVAGDVLTYKFTIIAGTTQTKIAADLTNALYLEYHPEDWALIKQNHPNAEGLLLAETYQYRAGSSSRSLLEQAHADLINYLNIAWQSRDKDLPYKNHYDLLSAASIIEKESAVPIERKLIAGVLVNRLKKGMPLQMDPTVIYALGSSYTGKLVHNDLLIDSPYNSYRYRGLPPTPIAMVSKESIMAAAHPQVSNFLYFVARGDGTHQFSENYKAQREAINQYKHKDS